MLDAVIRGFFDAIDHEWLVKFVEQRIADQLVVRHFRKKLPTPALQGKVRETVVQLTTMGMGISLYAMIGSRAGRCARWWGSWSGAVALLVAAVLGLEALPLSLEPLGETKAQAACWFEPINVCDTDGAVLRLLADTPVLPPASVAVAANLEAQPLSSAPSARLPEGFAPGVFCPPKYSS